MKHVSPEAAKLDAVLDSAARRPRDRIIWTASAIGRRIGTSPDFVRNSLAKLPGTPVKQVGRRLCAVEDDLIAFFRANQ